MFYPDILPRLYPATLALPRCYTPLFYPSSTRCYTPLLYPAVVPCCYTPLFYPDILPLYPTVLPWFYSAVIPRCYPRCSTPDLPRCPTLLLYPLLHPLSLTLLLYPAARPLPVVRYLPSPFAETATALSTAPPLACLLCSRWDSRFRTGFPFSPALSRSCSVPVPPAVTVAP